MAISTEEVARELLSALEEVFGPRAFAILRSTITQDYLGNEMDLASLVTKRPDLFERAIVSVLGTAGIPTLGVILGKLKDKLNLGGHVTYSKLGDFPVWMATVTKEP